MSNIDKQALTAESARESGNILLIVAARMARRELFTPLHYVSELPQKVVSMRVFREALERSEETLQREVCKIVDGHDRMQNKLKEAEAKLEAAEKRIAELEARDVKPVAWRLINSPESSLSVTDNKHIADVWKRNGRDVQALFPVQSVDLVPVGTALSEGRQMSAHNKSMVVDVMVESGKLTPGDKLYIAAAAVKGEAS